MKLSLTRKLPGTMIQDWLISKDSLLLGGILILGLLFRLLLVIYVIPYPERYIQGDAVGYDQLARNLTGGLGFSKMDQAPYIPDNFRTPVYPFFLAAFYTLFGYRPDLVILIQVLVSTGLILVTYMLGVQLKSSKVGLIAAGLVAISPYLMVYTGKLWSDILFTFLLSISLYLALRMLSTPRFRWAVSSGVMFGIATLTHPRTLYLPYLLAIIGLVYFLKNHHPIKRSLLTLGIYLLAFALILLPWQIRNSITFGVPNLSSAPGTNLLFYNIAIAEASQTKGDHWDVVRHYEASIRESSDSSLNEAQFSKEAAALAWKIILKNPIPYIRTHLIGSAKVFFPGTYSLHGIFSGEPDHDQEYVFSSITITPLSEENLLSKISTFPPMVSVLISFNTIYLISIYLISFITSLWGIRNNPKIWVLLASIVYLSGVVGAAGAPRFQIAFTPLLCVLAALSFERDKSMKMSVPLSKTKETNPFSGEINMTGVLNRVVQRYLIPQFMVAIYYSLRYRCYVSTQARVQLSNKVSFGKGTVVKPYAILQTQGGRICTGKECAISSFNHISTGTEDVVLGDFVRIGPQVTIMGVSRNFKSKDVLVIHQGSYHKGVVIENDVLVGAGVVILPGCRIGRGAVIGAMSLVNQDVPPYTIVAGVPAKVISKRE